MFINSSDERKTQQINNTKFKKNIRSDEVVDGKNVRKQKQNENDRFVHLVFTYC